jgi:hypothetical protein
MLLPFWMVLFSTSCFANVLGLNISATFNSAKVIYIIIPILIIPQLLFSGVIVRFDRLFPAISSQNSVPLIGNVMTSRWAYEAMAVHQFRNNEFNNIFFETDQTRKYCGWKKDYWVKELNTKIVEAQRQVESGQKAESFNYNLTVIRNEFEKEVSHNTAFKFPGVESLFEEKITLAILQEAELKLQELEQFYIRAYNTANGAREKQITALTSTPELRDQYLALQDDHYNESLEDFVTNKNDLKKIVEYEDQLVQKQNLIYLTPVDVGLFGAHFYAPSKPLFGKQITTLSANILVIWMMTIALVVVLFVDGLKRTFTWIGFNAERFVEKIGLKKKVEID